MELGLTPAPQAQQADGPGDEGVAVSSTPEAGKPSQYYLSDGRMLYVSKAGVAYAHRPTMFNPLARLCGVYASQSNTNYSINRCTWILDKEGVLTDCRGRQLFTDIHSWVGVAKVRWRILSRLDLIQSGKESQNRR